MQLRILKTEDTMLRLLTMYIRLTGEDVARQEKKRGEQFNELVKNKDVSCIFSVAGGDYLMEMLEYVDFESIKNNPKWFQGFSDNTTLIYQLLQNVTWQQFMVVI